MTLFGLEGFGFTARNFDGQELKPRIFQSPARSIAEENALTGTARATWDLSAGSWGGINTLQGFVDGFSVNRDQTVSFKIAQSDAAGWTADIYRLGYYGGNGARLIDTLTPTSGQLSASQSQPAPLDADPVTTKPSVDCSNWAATLEWQVPDELPSGIFLAKLNRTGGGASHVLFIVRDDERPADLMLMPSDSTWQAYNAFGGMGANMLAGNSLYDGTNVNQYAADCARFVSYNRPFVNRAAVNSGQSYGAVSWSTFFTGEYSMVRFLERNGIDVKYYGCIDAAGDPTGAKLANVKAAMMIGHNEYWSSGMRSGWEEAKAAGKSVFSCASNEVFWRMVGSNPDANSRPRTFECYKSTIAGRGSTGRPEWTGTWRDPDGTGKGGNDPENTLTGTIFVVNGPDLRSLKVPVAYNNSPLWRNTIVAGSSSEWVSPSLILGFEWDTYGPAGVSTSAAAHLADPHPQAQYASSSVYSVTSGLLLTDAGDVYDSAGTAEHRLVIQPSGSNGGITFGTGTINWALGLDEANAYHGVGFDNTSTPIRQATLNILADMGVLPTTPLAGLTTPTPHNWF